nr:Fic family protein [Arthrobacter castelli]
MAVGELLQQGSRLALDVVANVRATEDSITELADLNRIVTTTDIEHLQHVIEPSHEQGLRTKQNRVGGSGWSPLRSEFVPPPESEGGRLVEDLARFISATEGTPAVRAGAHVQFETIHPFIDGNGRTGRALIHTVLRRTSGPGAKVHLPGDARRADRHHDQGEIRAGGSGRRRRRGVADGAVDRQSARPVRAIQGGRR